LFQKNGQRTDSIKTGRSFPVSLKNFDFLLKNASKRNNACVPSIGKHQRSRWHDDRQQKPLKLTNWKCQFEHADAATLFPWYQTSSPVGLRRREPEINEISSRKQQIAIPAYFDVDFGGCHVYCDEMQRAFVGGVRFLRSSVKIDIIWRLAFRTGNVEG
jgi:hypothetical protein